ncbi:MAG: twin-arginine translocase TatA/TatE family subunit [Chlorobiaceae bacterium]|jgi:sec-independent protein translocase protein TatA
MFGLGGQELLLILFVVLLFFGPSKLPELARGLGKGMREFKKAQADLEHEFNKVAENSEAEDKPVEAVASKEAHSGSESKKS